MNTDLEQIKSDLDATKAIVTKINNDITKLYDTINSVTNQLPTTEEWAAVKAAAAEVKNQAQGVDDRTPE